MHTYETLKGIIDRQGSRIFSVEFVKKDGSYRSMQCQAAATATHCSQDPSERAQRAARTRAENHPNLVPIYSMDAGAIRSINLDTVLRLIGEGTVLYEVEDAGKRIYEAKRKHG